MLTPEMSHFVTNVLPVETELRNKLPYVMLRLPVTIYLDEADNIWPLITSHKSATTGPLPVDNYLTNFIRMVVEVRWVNSPPSADFNYLVHDLTTEGLEALLIKAGLA